MKFTDLYDAMSHTRLSPHIEEFRDALNAWRERSNHGLQSKWDANRAALAGLTIHSKTLNESVVRLGTATDMSQEQAPALERALQDLHPWRKGPFEILGTHIETEWRSDWKWDRVSPEISDLKGRLVLDVGSGSGYHCWRMLGAGAEFVLGIELMVHYVEQFRLCKQLYGPAPIHVLPLGFENIPVRMGVFDTVFSMGLLYHRKAPIQHLEDLKDSLRPGGEVVLDTLVVEGPLHHVLVPDGRYAQMRNVWFLPSVETLRHWMIRAGFEQCRVVDVSVTTFEEQKSTPWMRFHSLQDFLHPDEPTRTVEGHPRPTRAVLVARKPE